MMNIALILSGGTGERLGAGMPKQYLLLGGRPVISYCLDVFFNHMEIDAVQIVAWEGWHQLIAGQIGMIENKLQSKFTGFSKPGEVRQLSILNGLEDIRKFAAANDTVVIHDAARPLISRRLITDELRALRSHSGAVPALPVKDTVYLGDGKRITSLLDRRLVYAGQTPESFQLEEYYGANKRLLPDEIRLIHGSAEPAVLAGMDVALTEGDEMNFKITTREDLERFRQILAEGGR